MIHVSHFELVLMLLTSWALGIIAGGYWQFWRPGGTHELLISWIKADRRNRLLEDQLASADRGAMDRYRDADPPEAERAQRADLAPLASVIHLPAAHEGGAAL